MRRVAILAILLLMLTGTACWDARSLDQRAFVVMLGIDPGPDEGFRVSLQVQRAGFEEEKKEKGGTPASRVLAAEGRTLREALERVRDDLAREVDTTFLDVIVIGKEVAANYGLDELDWLVRTFRIPVSAFVSVAPGDAETVVRAGAAGYGMPAEHALFGLIGGSWTRSAAIVPGPMWMVFNRNYFTQLEDPFAPVLSGEGGQLHWNGLAVFRGHTLAGLLDERDAAIFNLLMGSRSERVITADISDVPGAKATLYVQRARVKRKVTWEGNRPAIQVQIMARGTLQELTKMRLTSLRNEKAVETALADALILEMKRLISHLQALDADPVGFGELARQEAPYRKEVQNGDAWREVYRDARVEVTARVIMVAPGYMK